MDIYISTTHEETDLQERELGGLLAGINTMDFLYLILSPFVSHVLDRSQAYILCLTVLYAASFSKPLNYFAFDP